MNFAGVTIIEPVWSWKTWAIGAVITFVVSLLFSNWRGAPWSNRIEVSFLAAVFWPLTVMMIVGRIIKAVFGVIWSALGWGKDSQD